jgi:N-acetylglucosaminyldiphosphoundecaprenol N-acetyl-beta-D-mannosaminyltransferase
MQAEHTVHPLLGVNTHAQSFRHAVQTLAGWAADAAGRRYVCTCPVYTLMMCRENPDVMRAVNGADMVTADGMPIVWLQRRTGAPDAERVYGPDVLDALCAAGSGIAHYFYGGTPEVVSAMIARLRARHPDLKIAGSFSPPVAPLGSAPDPAHVARLNESGAGIVWVGLGSPKQDLWMAQYRPHLMAPLLIGVGAAFDMAAGAKRQAPRWMQRSGLEWLFRLAQEPRRLAKRYLVYNPKFMLLAAREIGLKR